MVEQSISVNKIDHISELFGNFDENIILIENQFHVKIANRGDDLKIGGDAADVKLAVKTVSMLIKLMEQGETINGQNLRYLISLVREGKEDKFTELNRDCLCITARGKPVKPKTIGQKQYIEAIKSNTIVLGIGPAGTGKTYLAVAMAVAAFKNKEVSRIVLTRPAVEAGEKLGFLPGDLQEKVDPYLRPLYDALFDMMGEETFQKLLERQNIEVAPLAYMRGRTLDNSFIILDEAQNTTPEQMKMFLTRLGFNSKAVITGDISQIDLPGGQKSGLVEASKVLENVEDIGINYFSDKDVVRHPLVQRIVRAYDQYERERRTHDSYE